MFDTHTRREFCARACRGAAMAAAGGVLGVALEGCGGSPIQASAPALPVINASLTNNTLVLTIDAGSPLAAVGGAALVQASTAAVLVTRTAQSTFVALSSTCLHQGCTITEFASGTFVCPCHGAQYSTSGQSVGGPAVGTLPQFKTQFANNVLTIG